MGSSKHPGSAKRLIVIGASAGGIGALTRLVPDLPADLRAAVVIIVHAPPGAPSVMADILGRSGPLPAREACDGDRLRRGCILTARPGRHLVLQDAHVRLLDTPPVNHAKPAIDILFRSGAREYGPRLVAVVLSGTLSDGSLGLVAVRRAGGMAVVQDPKDAEFPGMPENAVAAAGADYCVPLREMATLLEMLARGRH